jgi:hypothetical protein
VSLFMTSLVYVISKAHRPVFAVSLSRVPTEFIISTEKRYIRHMTNNNEYDLNQTLVMVWGRFYNTS